VVHYAIPAQIAKTQNQIEDTSFPSFPIDILILTNSENRLSQTGVAYKPAYQGYGEYIFHALPNALDQTCGLLARRVRSSRPDSNDWLGFVSFIGSYLSLD